MIIDPSAASFKVLLRQAGYRVKDADNDVNDGIRMVAMLFRTQHLHIHERCQNTRDELASYVWDEKAALNHGQEKPVKQSDHACDAMRYCVKTMIKSWRLSAYEEEK